MLALVACSPENQSEDAAPPPTTTVAPSGAAQTSSRAPATAKPVEYTVQLSCQPNFICGEVVKATQLNGACRFELGAPFAGRSVAYDYTPCPPQLQARYELVASAGGVIRHLVPVRVKAVTSRTVMGGPGCAVSGSYADPFWDKFYRGRDPGALIDSASECGKLRPSMVAAVPVNWAFKIADGAAWARSSDNPGWHVTA
jgi:hypothetical protein